MNGRIKKLGIILALFGLAFVAAGGYAFIRMKDGAKSLQAFSAAQGVKHGATRSTRTSSTRTTRS